MSDNLQLILRAVQEFDISVSRATELIEIDQEGKFNYDLLSYGAGTQAIFGFDEVPVQKYKELLSERDSLVRVLKIANKNLFDVQEAAKIITKQAIVAETERDALAAKLKDAEHDRDEFRRVMNGFAEKMAELEGQEPVAWIYDWQAPEDLIRDWSTNNAAEIPEGATNIRPLYARPVPAEPVNARLLDALSALLDDIEALIGESAGVYGLHLNGDVSPWSELEEGGRFERLSSMSRAREAIAAAAHTEPVNTQLLEALVAFKFLPGDANRWEESDEENLAAVNSAIAAAEAQQAGPVRPKVSFIPSVENMPMARSIDDEMMDLVDRLGALEPVDPRAWKHLLVYAPKTDPVRLTRVDIEKAFAQAGLKPEDYREDGEILPLVIAIESATLRKNGIEVAE